MSNIERALVACLTLAAVVLGLVLCSASLDRSFANSAARLERAGR